MSAGAGEHLPFPAPPGPEAIQLKPSTAQVVRQPLYSPVLSTKQLLGARMDHREKAGPHVLEGPTA